MTVAAAAAAFALGGLGVATAASASALPLTTCTLTKGSIKLKPGLPLVPPGTVQTTTIKISATCVGGNVTGVNVSGSITNPAPATATSLLGVGTNPVSFTAKWKVVKKTPKLPLSVITINNTYGDLSFFDAPATSAETGGAAGTSTIAGAFAGHHLQAHALIGSDTVKVKKGISIVTAVVLAGGTFTIT